MLVQGWYAATPTFPPTTNVGPTYLCYLCSDPKHKIWRPLILFANSKHTRTWVRKGGGGTLIFSNIRRPGPFLGLTFWYFVMTPKDIHKIFIPQKIFIFLKTLKGIEIQNFEPQNGASLRMNENIIVPPPPPLHPLLADRTRGRGRPDSNNRKITLIRVFIVVFFATILYFFTVQKGRNIYRGGGGGCNFLLFFFGGGGWGGQIFISIETYITCDFSGGGGGGGPDHLSLSGFAHG